MAALVPAFGHAADYSHLTPLPGPAQSIGGHANGCVAGAVALPLSGPGWEVLRPASNRFWGNPALIATFERLAGITRPVGTLLVGDIGMPRGGPMSSGHASHQIGLDMDILLRVAHAPLTAQERNDPAFDDVVKPDNSIDPQRFGADQVAVLKAFVADPTVERIFVNPAIKRALCASEPDRAWLHKIRPWWGHDAHFHVRFVCPKGEKGCIDGAPIPAGDGCDASLDWWFTADAKTPAPPGPAKPKPALPKACRAILSAR
jgi:penicillin-insensitive murein endopeptidase